MAVAIERTAISQAEADQRNGRQMTAVRCINAYLHIDKANTLPAATENPFYLKRLL